MNDYTKEYRVLACNDAQNYCSLCEKENLKKVVWLEHIESGKINHVCKSCAAKFLKINTKNFNKNLKIVLLEIKKTVRREISESKEKEEKKEELKKKYMLKYI